MPQQSSRYSVWPEPPVGTVREPGARSAASGLFVRPGSCVSSQAERNPFPCLSYVPYYHVKLLTDHDGIRPICKFEAGAPELEIREPSNQPVC